MTTTLRAIAPALRPHHPLTAPLVAAQFALFGITFAAISVLWKDIIADVGISAGTLGAVLAAMPIAGAPIMLLGGYFGDRLSPRLLPLLGSALLLVFVVGLLGPASLPLLVLAVVIQGMGNGFYEVAINSAAVDYERRATVSLMNAFHAAFNVGAVVAALGTGVLRSAGVSYREILTGLAALFALMLIAIWRIPPPAPVRDAAAAPPNWRGTVRLFRGNRTLRLMAIILCAALITEGTAGAWATLYLRGDVGLAPWIGGAGYALFNVMMAVGRFGNQRLLAALGPRRALVAGGVAAMFATALMLATAQPVVILIGFAALGLAASGVFPTGFIIVGRVVPGGIALVNGVLFALAYLAWAASSPIVGVVADAFSLRVALGILGLVGAVVALVAARLPAQEEAAHASLMREEVVAR